MTTDWPGATMAEFAGRFLIGMVDRPVVDRTGLTGQFDIHLEIGLDSGGNGPVRLNGVDTPPAPATASEPTGPSIFAALQDQLGLKLTPDKAPVDVLVIDSVERPSAN